ncbi:hypothetical protein MYCTH_2301476 [Thermothelomyces thermophilus ATCC 42464]|uniref:t-SNARE affecting a late Golgi compartment protein 1 n=1 Tax=Thermothelomyces thermophilus (strain ATCC 42464 / BCRC 31852 / DSM 1799) TaxID=573729 RepID=G2Q9L4_THET4|nr:uncharacterized protein MYCTH_2301476 [Thermothelomyces thermophilus ATCC 42464]AEO56473.1 hypothetical protein MYCTH_2301476 [Thermothelomyces thermophilus ATCC 42464]
MMSSTNEEDPFLQVQQDVLTQLQTARSLFTSYLRIRSLATSPTSPELASARSDLESSIASLAEDLADLVESVRVAESDPAQYGLSAAEVARRKRLVQEVGGEVDDMREELAKVSSSGTAAATRRGQKGTVGGGGGGGGSGADDLPDPSSFAIPDGETDGTGGINDYAAEFEREQQAVLMREQDEHLDGVLQTVGNLRRQAGDMGRELDEQVEMLEVVDHLANRVEGRLQTGMEKLKYVIRRNEDRLSSCCIGVLIVVLIILLILLLVL